MNSFNCWREAGEAYDVEGRGWRACAGDGKRELRPACRAHDADAGRQKGAREEARRQKKPVAKKPAAKKPVAKKAVAKTPAAATPAVDHSAMGHTEPQPEAPVTAPQAAPDDHSQMDHGPEAQPAPAPVDHSAMGHGQEAPPAAPVDHTAMGHDAPGGHAAMRGALGNYPMTREASGTAWQPDTSKHSGPMIHAGDWMLMAHGNLDLIGSWQGGPRGDDKVFVAGMLMGMAKREFANGNALQFRAMISPDPLMGKSGYPLLLASGETADGVEHLVDRQHPHDFFMELSASYSVKLAEKASAFVYAGLPGEPAFGPPAFMHRQSISTSPEAPITHHWLDSTHITFGVVTAGLVYDRAKLEVSRFNGREPDQHRWNIETGAARFDLGPPVVEPDRQACRCRAAGRIWRSPSSSSPASTSAAGRRAGPIRGR